MSSKSQLYIPLGLAVTLCIGILMGLRLGEGNQSDGLSGFSTKKGGKLNEILTYIEHEYVDTINRAELEEKAIQTLLQELDPHSYYIPPQDLAAANEPLEGNFEGIGVEFRIQRDTVTIITPIAGGPSARLGIVSGDRIVSVEGENIAGNGITNAKVIKLLRGEKGTMVNVEVRRNGVDKLIPFEIERDQIPIYSVDIAYMLNDEIGYVKISRFARTTYEEFKKATESLLNKGMKKLIIDLRGNGGGYMDAAVDIVDEMLPAKKLIVFTQGKARSRKNEYSTKKGALKDIDIGILIDESSASASEIVAGAIQDNDRGIIFGRRSFGKGLVQEPSQWPDGSALRLTIARYYTPTGRCIQKPYKDGVKQYYRDYYDRVKKGELMSIDSIDFPDSLKFTTPAGKTVYGGGGIMPDVFVPYDTTGHTYFYSELIYSGAFRQFGFDYADHHRDELNQYKTASEAVERFYISAPILSEFFALAKSKGVEKNESGYKMSEGLIKMRLKAEILNNIWNNEGLYPVLHKNDKTIARAIEVL
ncbi:MAG: S41 family peptidase [Flavobacteriales bacterium]|nr:S41 family peptidase [Flavobacteriales bacterium]